MPRALTIRVGTLDAAGNFVPAAAGTPVYMKPSRQDITYLNGTDWYPWEINKDSDNGFRDCWKAVSNGTGWATFSQVPYTDTEMHRPLDQAGQPIGPEIEWNVINPSGANGTVVYSGKLLSTMGLAATVKVPDDLTQLPADAWRVSGAAYVATPIGGQMYIGNITFPMGVTQMAANFPIPFAAPPRVLVGSCYDKDNNYSSAGFAQDGSGNDLITVSNATIKIAAGLSADVRVPFLVLGA